MLEILRAELDKYHAFDAPSHPFVDSIVRAIPFTTVPEKMKTVFAISHVSQYASQFRRNTKLWDGTEVPTNNISFVVAASGANKDSSNSKVKACFKEGYKAIHAELEVYVRDEAIKAAQKAEEELPEEYAIYSKYMKPIPPPFMAMSTGPGLVQHINDIGALPLGAGMQYVGELSDELLGNPNAVENLKVLAECYTADMEVLTEKGFMLFSELPKDVKVAQWNKVSREITFALPTSYIEKEYHGDILNFRASGAYDFSVTPNHGLTFEDREHNVLTSTYADNVAPKDYSFITQGRADKLYESSINIRTGLTAEECDAAQVDAVLSGAYSVTIKTGDTYTLLEGGKKAILTHLSEEEISIPESLSVSDYNGMVYCVEMPEGTVIIRRNGLVNFNGNCFDLGNKEVSYTKGTEFRSKEITYRKNKRPFHPSPTALDRS